MKKLIVAVMFGLMAIAAQAEATFDQIQTLIQQQNYSAAEKGLEEIIRNHPKSAKAFYAMSQAQAGLGNQDKAKKALDIATGLNPTLDFAPQSSVASLKDAITPQVKKIESIEESHFWRNTLMVLFALTIVGGIYMLWRKKEDEAEAAREKALAELQAERELQDAIRKREHMEMLAQQEAERQALRAHKNYGNERFDPTNPDVLLPKKTKAEIKAETEALALREVQARADAAEADARRARISANYVAPAPAPVVNNHYGSNNGGNDMLTGMLVGNMLSNSSHHNHDTTIIREREVYRDAPVRDSSWDTPAPRATAPVVETKSSSWDDDSSSSKSSSSSWSSSSDSSSSSSSWDSGSSSSDSSSSSWD